MCREFRVVITTGIFEDYLRPRKEAFERVEETVSNTQNGNDGLFLPLRMTNLIMHGTLSRLTRRLLLP